MYIISLEIVRGPSIYMIWLIINARTEPSELYHKQNSVGKRINMSQEQESVGQTEDDIT